MDDDDDDDDDEVSARVLRRVLIQRTHETFTRASSLMSSRQSIMSFSFLQWPPWIHPVLARVRAVIVVVGHDHHPHRSSVVDAGHPLHVPVRAKHRPELFEHPPRDAREDRAEDELLALDGDVVALLRVRRRDHLALVVLVRVRRA
eukprot:29239-Pelagococcus_subviridis.AAC.3